MNRKDRRRVLFKVACEVFETAAFAMVEPPEEAVEPVPKGDEVLATLVEFTGPFRGAVAIAAPKTLARTLGSNMLCLEDDVMESTVEKHDALKEVLNMICGRLLPAIAGPKLEFKIGAPGEIEIGEFIRITASAPRNGSSKVDLVVEGRAVEVLFLADEEAIESVVGEAR